MTQTAIVSKLTAEDKTRTDVRLFSRFIFAVLLFILLNGYLNAEDYSKGLAPETISEKLFDYNGVEQSAKFVSRTANVIVLGSSLFAHPEWSVDRTLLLHEPYEKQTIVAQSHYHFAEGLTNDLEQRGFTKSFVYNLAADGALISDAYLLLYHYLKNHPTPSVVVLDCAPRSFNDTGVTEANATPVFDCCFQMQDFLELHAIYLKGIDAKVDYLLSKASFLFHHRKWLSESVQHWLAGLLTPHCVQGSSKTIVAERAESRSESRASNKTTASESEESQRLARSLQEYKDRYQWMNSPSIENQMKFLKSIQDLCDRKQIELIVVNMPLTSENRRLLSTGFYDNFRSVLMKTMGARGSMLDLGSVNWPQSYYYDSVHLNAKGGSQLNKLIADRIARARSAQ